MFLIRNEKVILYTLLAALVLLTPVVSYCSWAVFDTGVYSADENFGILGLSYPLQIVMLAPYFIAYKRTPLAAKSSAVVATLLFNFFMIWTYWSNTPQPCCGHMGQGLVLVAYLFMAVLYSIGSALVLWLKAAWFQHSLINAWLLPLLPVALFFACLISVLIEYVFLFWFA